MNLNAEYWNQRYLSGQTGWDAGEITTPMQAYIDQLPNLHLPILIPGGGNSHEAAYLLTKGFTNISIVDIAPTLKSRLETKFKAFPGHRWRVIIDDFFNLTGTYDLILEQTFFCALNPAFRKAYVSKTHNLLAPGGKLVGVLFDRPFDGGPPFGGSIKEYRQLFAPYYQIKVMEPCYNSILSRAGTEVFMILQKAF